MTRPETGTLPPAMTPEQELKFLYQKAYRLMDYVELTQFHSDADVRLKVNRLRMEGVWPTPNFNDESDMTHVRAFLAGFYAGVRHTVRVSRSGGIA